MDDFFMQEAVVEAKKSLKKNEVPVGAVIVRNGKIIARAHNLRNRKKCVTQHAEMIAITKACKRIGDFRLEECDLYVTMEPCPMCAGAIIQARMKRLIYGCVNEKSGCAGSIMDLFAIECFNHKVEVTTSVLQKECGDLLKTFFLHLRAEKRK